MSNDSTRTTTDSSSSSTSKTKTKSKSTKSTKSTTTLQRQRLLERQLLHIIILTGSTLFTATKSSDVVASRIHYYDIINPIWIVYLILLLRILHHLIITIIWRTELYCSDNKLSIKVVNSKDVALKITECIDIGYFVLAGNLLIGLSYIDYGSFEWLLLNQHTFIRFIFGIICLLLGIWGIGSSLIALGITHLSGADHFFYEYKYCDFTIIKEGGAFTYCQHPIYVLGILLEWSIGILTCSKLCLYMALSSHICALTFLYCTELPDMDFIYTEIQRRQQHDITTRQLYEHHDITKTTTTTKSSSTTTNTTKKTK